MTSSSTVAVSGAGGFVGRNLVAALDSRGHDVVAWHSSDADLTDPKETLDLMARDRPGAIFHLAAVGARPGEADTPEAVAANVAMAVNLVSAAEPGTLLIMAGTMAEYGKAGALAESDLCTPRTAYAIGKYVAGTFAMTYGPKRGLVVRVARLFGAYGPGEHPDRLFPSLTRELRAGRPVPLSDGLQRRDFVHVSDVSEALIRIAGVGSDQSFVVNVGTGQAVNVGDVCRWVAESVGADESLLRFDARERSPGDADVLEADTALLRDLIGWVPPQRLRPGVAQDLFAGD